MKMTFNKTRIILTTLVFLIMAAFTSGKGVYAQADPSRYSAEDVCKPATSNFKWGKMILDGSIRETTSNVMRSYIMDGVVELAYGVDINTLMGCTGPVIRGAGDVALTGGNPVFGILQDEPDCNDTDPLICNNIFAATGEGPSGTGTLETDAGNRLRTLSNSALGGSLLGLANNIEYATTEPLPVNMAYYFYDVGTRLPIVGDRVYAAEIVNYHPLMEDIFDIWRAVRNLSYALMSIVMVVTGISIIIGRKLSSQLVVSVQYAIPKIIIALVLITFSYPIMATIATVGWALFRSAPNIVRDFLGTAGTLNSNVVATIGMGGLLVGLLILFLTHSGVGTFLILVAVIILAIILAIWIFAWLKAFIEFLKIIFATILAPIEFVVYALPGNEDRLQIWAKKMLAYLLTMFLLGSMLAILNFIAVQLIFGNGVIAGILYAVFAPILVYLYGLSLTIGIPKKVTTWLAVEPTKRR